MTTRSLYRLQIALLATYGLLVGVLWPALPDRLPVHFNFSGRPTTWAATTFLSWSALFLIAMVMTLFLYGLGRVASAAPELWNLPEKERFLALSPAERLPIEEELTRVVAFAPLLVTLNFMIIHAAMYLTATGEIRGMNPWILLLPVGAILFIALRGARRAAQKVREIEATLPPPARSDVNAP